MTSERSFKGLKKYESLLKTICLTDNYDCLEHTEWEGCLGVACAISVIEGGSSNLFALSKHLDIPSDNQNLQKAFERLRINGIFNGKYNIKNDRLLTGNGYNTTWQKDVERERNAWCNIAGIAGGFVGLKECEKKGE